MIEIERSSLEARILEMLLEVYPMTVNELARELKLSKKTMERHMKKLQSRGIVDLEPLPDKVFIRLLRRDIRFVGKVASQRTPVKKKGKKKGKKDYEGLAYA
jgi:predicted ArsR family transcriptional regulator